MRNFEITVGNQTFKVAEVPKATVNRRRDVEIEVREAAIHAAFGSQDINTAHWCMDGGEVVTFVEAMQRVMRAA